MMVDCFSFTSLDWVIVAVIFASVLIGMWRGFVVEFMSLLPWVAATFATFYATPQILPYFYRLLGKSFLAEVLAMLSIFILTVLFLSVLRPGMKEKVRESSLSGFDRFLGLIFGIIRGGGVVGGFYICALFFSDYKAWPEAVSEARLSPYIRSMSEWAANYFPAHIREKIHFPGESTPAPIPEASEISDS